MGEFYAEAMRAGVDWCRLRTEIDAAMMARDDSYDHPHQAPWDNCLRAARQALGDASERDIHEYAARLHLHLPPNVSKPHMTPQEWAECRGAQALYFYRIGGSARGLDRFIDSAHEDYYDGAPEQQATIAPAVMAEFVRAAFERAKRSASSLDEPSLSHYGSTPARAVSDEKRSQRVRDDKSNAAFTLLRSTGPALEGRALTAAWLSLMKTAQSEWPADSATTPRNH